MRRVSVSALGMFAVAALGLTACGGDSNNGSDDSTGDTVSVEHALGTTEVPENPERVATVNWANHEVPLALGTVPVGMAAADFGDDDDNGILPWVEDELEELDPDGENEPVLFDETDGIDFEAVSDTDPDVILAGYSGLTEEDYETLSDIAPVVAYPDGPWATTWDDTIDINSQGMNQGEEGQELIDELRGEIDQAASDHEELAGKKTMFLTHVDTSDLSEVSFYTDHDTRVSFFHDLGMESPQAVEEASADTDEFSETISAEQVDMFDDVDIIVTYGDEELKEALNEDPLLSQMPAVQNDSIVFLDGEGPMGTAANPTPLSISYVLDDYTDELSDAAEKAE